MLRQFQAGTLSLAASTAIGLCDHPSTTQNLLTNGSFELGLGAEPFFPGWRVEKPDFVTTETPPLPRLDTEFFHSGRQSLKLSRSHGRAVMVLDIQTPQLPAGSPTSLTFWAKSAQPGVKAEGGLTPADGKGRKLGNPTRGDLTVDWQQFRVELPATPSPTSVRLEFSDSGTEPFDVWVDDICWAQGEHANFTRSGPVEIVLIPESRNGIRFAGSPTVLTWSSDSDRERKIQLTVKLTDIGRRDVRMLDLSEQADVLTQAVQGKLNLGSLKRGAYLAEVEARDSSTGDLLGTGRERFTVMTDLRGQPALVHFDVGYHGGIEFGTEMGFNWRGYWSLDEFFATNYQTGFRIQRDIFDWFAIQPAPEKSDWEYLDRRVDAADRNGCSTIVCVPHSPLYLDRKNYSEILDGSKAAPGDWIYQSAKDISEYSVRSAVMGGAKDPAERKVLLAPDPKVLVRFLTELVNRYRGKIAAIEFMNEANLFITPKGLIEYYFKPAYMAMKATAPDLPVLMNQTMDYASDGNGYTGQFLSQGGFEYSDGIMHHPYGAALLNDNGLPSAKTLERLALKYSRPDKPMILGMSEIHGIGDYTFLRGEPVQRALIDWSIGCRWSAGVLLPYTNFYEGTGPRKWFLRGCFVPGLAAVQMNALYAKLGGFQFQSRIELDDRVLISVFRQEDPKPKRPCYAVAMTASDIPSSRAILETNLDGIDFEAFDAFGELMPQSSRREISLGPDTIYLQSSNPALLERLKEARVSWSQILNDDRLELKGQTAFDAIYLSGLPPVQRDTIGLIQQWTVLNGVPESEGEASPPKLGLSDSSGRLIWPEKKTRIAGTETPYVLLAGRVSSERQFHYAYAEIFSDEAREVPMYLSATGPVAAWVNGAPIPGIPTFNFGLFGSTWKNVTIPLKKGVNPILLQVVSNGAPCAFALSANEKAFPSGRIPVNEEGYLLRWKIIGPWANPKNGQGDFLGNDKVFPPEETIDLGAYYSGLDAFPLIWHQASHADATIPHPWKNAISYALATVEVPENTPCFVSLGSDDGYALWVNRELVGRRSISRALKFDDEKIPVTLQKGSNQILFKIEDTGGGGGFALRFLQEDGRPVVLKGID